LALALSLPTEFPTADRWDGPSAGAISTAVRRADQYRGGAVSCVATSPSIYPSYSRRSSSCRKPYLSPPTSPFKWRVRIRKLYYVECHFPGAGNPSTTMDRIAVPNDGDTFSSPKQAGRRSGLATGGWPRPVLVDLTTPCSDGRDHPVYNEPEKDQPRLPERAG